MTEAGTVPYEGSAHFGGAHAGTTVYDDGFPVVGAPVAKGTDAAVGYNVPPNSYVEWSELDYEVGGVPGAVNRNAYVDSGIPVLYDAHDFRGDHAVIPSHYPYGSYGDAGDSSNDPTVQYAQGIAANAYPDITSEQSWDAVSEGY